MRILGFETSAKAVSVALLQDGRLLAEYMQNSGQTHSRTLMKLAQDLLTNCDLTEKDVDAVACAAGPGSFTGIRIGMAAAKGFAWGRNLPCYGVSTLEAMAKGVVQGNSYICAAMDARRNQVYAAVFRCENGTIDRVLNDSAISVEELGNILKNLDQTIFLVGDGAELCYNQLKAAIEKLCLLPEHIRMQRAAGVALLAWEEIQAGVIGDGEQLIPNYLRLSQAERERLSKQNKE